MYLVLTWETGKQHLVLHSQASLVKQFFMMTVNTIFATMNKHSKIVYTHCYSVLQLMQNASFNTSYHYICHLLCRLALWLLKLASWWVQTWILWCVLRSEMRRSTRLWKRQQTVLTSVRWACLHLLKQSNTSSIINPVLCTCSMIVLIKKFEKN